jgi:hypothetical protein
MMDEPCQKSKKGTVLQVVEQGSLALVVLLLVPMKSQVIVRNGLPKRERHNCGDVTDPVREAKELVIVVV